MEKRKKADFTPAIPKLTPSFIAYFDIAKTLGGWPFTGSKQGALHG